MKRRPRIHYTEEQRALMWERWQKGESLEKIAQLFDRHHTSIEQILAETGVRVETAKGRQILKDAGADVDKNTKRLETPRFTQGDYDIQENPQIARMARNESLISRLEDEVKDSLRELRAAEAKIAGHAAIIDNLTVRIEKCEQ